MRTVEARTGLEIEMQGETIFYDGDCGVCHWSVKWVARRDRGEAPAFRFAPIGGRTFDSVFTQGEEEWPDSIAIATRDGRILWRSTAMIHILRRLGGGWSWLAALLAMIPRPLRDLGYDGFARIRHRLVARPEGTCPMVPPELGRRFDP